MRNYNFITTPIFYANAAPHIGHLYTSLLADAFSRWNDVKHGRNTKNIFVSGTDEHGVKIQKAAQTANMETKAYCDKISENYKNLFAKFNIKPTHFIRTTDRNHRSAVENIWESLKKAGLIYKGKYNGWYSIVDECFYQENETEDTDFNGRTIKISKATRSAVEWVEEDNYVFDSSGFKTDIRRWILNNNVIRPKIYVSSALQCLDAIDHISVSRDRKRVNWGINVPGDPTQTIYVWMDALINYLSAVNFPIHTSSHWPPTHQFIGKDILKFHVTLWPSILMAMNLALPEVIFVHGHWLVDRVKMSKSAGNVVDPFEAAELLTFEGLRYFLLRQGKPYDDINFTMKKAIDVINSDLANNIGNLLQRSTTNKLNPSQTYPEFNRLLLETKFSELGIPLIDRLNALPEVFDECVSNSLFYKAFESVAEIARETNAFFHYYEPWRSSNSEEISTLLFVVYEVLRVCGILLQPAVPEYADRILTRLGINAYNRTLNEAVFNNGKLSGNVLRKINDILLHRVNESNSS